VTGQRDKSSILPDANASSLFGTSASLLDTPRTVSQVNADQLSKDIIFSSDDFIKYAPGITAGGGQNAGLTPTIRGQASELYQDGQRVFSVRHPSNFNAFEG
jgi:outer membrane receptor for monomeric catechols